MKIIALEEHFVTPEVLKAWRDQPTDRRDPALDSTEGERGELLLDLGPRRLQVMADAGVDVQVLSLSTPGVQSLAAREAVDLQTSSNDFLAAAVRANPEKFQGVATLATPDPKAAVKELERSVKKLGMNGAMVFGRTGDRNMDHKDFWPIYEAAEAMRAPLYLHPQTPQPAVREAYYSGYSPAIETSFARAGIGWHYESGVQLIRMVLSGVFDEFPDLQIITGHWGEVVLYYLERVDMMTKVSGLKQPISEYFKQNVMITPSGLFSQRYFQWAIDVLGIDRILFSVDYPFLPIAKGGSRKFLEEAQISQADREKVAHGNWEKICAGIRR